MLLSALHQAKISCCVPSLLESQCYQKKLLYGCLPSKKHIHAILTNCITVSQSNNKKNFFFFLFGQMYSMSPPDRKAKDQTFLCRQFLLFFLFFNHEHLLSVKFPVSIVNCQLSHCW